MLVEVPEIKEIPVVVESAPLGDLLVGRVDLSDHHIHQHCGQHQSDSSKEEEACPLSSEVVETDSSDCSFDQHLHARVERRAGVGLFRQKDGERAARDEKDQDCEEDPRQKTHCVDFDKFGEGAEDPGGFEREVEAERNSNDDETRKVGLRHRGSSEDLVVVNVAGEGVSCRVPYFVNRPLQKEYKPKSLNESDHLKGNRVTAECLPQRAAALKEEEKVERGSQRVKRQKHAH